MKFNDAIVLTKVHRQSKIGAVGRVIGGLKNKHEIYIRVRSIQGTKYKTWISRLDIAPHVVKRKEPKV